MTTTNRLKYVNNWESDEYYVGKNRVKTLAKVEINGVEFPVISRKVSVDYNDHGNRFSAMSEHFFIALVVGGVLFERDLNSMGSMKIVAVEWE
jgi:hypothetical protein